MLLRHTLCSSDRLPVCPTACGEMKRVHKGSRLILSFELCINLAVPGCHAAARQLSFLLICCFFELELEEGETAKCSSPNLDSSLSPAQWRLLMKTLHKCSNV